MSTLPLASPKLYTLRVLHTSSLLRIESKDGAKKCLIDLCKMDALETTDRERSLVYPLTEGPVGMWSDETFTLDDLQVLASLRDRTGMKGASEVKPSSPSPVNAPAPVSVQETVPSVPSEGPSVPSDASQTAPVVSAPVVPLIATEQATDVAPALPTDPLDQFRNALVSHIVDQDDSAFRSKRSRVARLSRRKKKPSKPGNDLLELTQSERARLRACKQWMRFGYDIGTHLQSKVGNFYRLIHGIGVRYRLSELLIPEDALQIPAFAAMLAYWDTFASEGLEYDIDYVDPRSTKKARETAINKEVKALRAAHKAIIENLESCTKKFEEEWAKLPPEATEKEQGAILNERDCAIRTNLRKAAEFIANSIQSAELFDITGETEHCRQALIATQRARAVVFNEYASRRGISPAPMPENVTRMADEE